MASYDVLRSMLEEVHSSVAEVEIEETGQKIKIPKRALGLLVKIMEATSQGKPVSVVPIATEMTTQSAAEFLGCSRPHLIKLLEAGEMPYTKVGRHRRVKFQDVAEYKKKMKQDQEDSIAEMMRLDEEAGLYDS